MCANYYLSLLCCVLKLVRLKAKQNLSYYNNAHTQLQSLCTWTTSQLITFKLSFKLHKKQLLAMSHHLCMYLLAWLYITHLIFILTFSMIYKVLLQLLHQESYGQIMQDYCKLIMRKAIKVFQRPHAPSDSFRLFQSHQESFKVNQII